MTPAIHLFQARPLHLDDGGGESFARSLLQKEQKFLSTFQFEVRPLRHDTIPEAQEQTFRWLLEKEADENLRRTSQDSPTLKFWQTVLNWPEKCSHLAPFRT